MKDSIKRLRNLRKNNETSLHAQISAATRKTKLILSQGEVKTGKYPMGTFFTHDVEISIENPQGTVRMGQTRDGKEWQVIMPHHYGFFVGTKSQADGDPIDVFVGDSYDSEKVFIIDQFFDGKFDEHKVMIFFKDGESAIKGYRASFDSDWNGNGAFKELTWDQLKDWMQSGHTSEPLTGIATLRKIRRIQKSAELKDGDFVFPSVKAFPITDGQSVKNAIASFGRSRYRDKFGQFRKRLIAIARRKGLLEFIPSKWKREIIQSNLNLAKTFQSETQLMKGYEVGDKMYLFGVVLRPEVVDSQGHIVSKEVIKKAARQHLANHRGVGLRHKVMVTNRDVVLTQSFVNCSGRSILMHGIDVPDGAWVVEHEVLSPQLKDDVRRGVYRGYSVGGKINATSRE
jgi:hypothetical protein